MDQSLPRNLWEGGGLGESKQSQTVFPGACTLMQITRGKMKSKRGGKVMDLIEDEEEGQKVEEREHGNKNK